MSPGPATAELRAVLGAPRGRRFSRPGTSTRPMATPCSESEPSDSAFKAREQHILAHMVGNPRVAHRQAHGVLPHWMHLQATRIVERERQAHADSAHSEHLERPEGPWKPSPTPDHRPLPIIPRPRPAPDDGPPPPRPPRPPLPRRPRRPHSHRKPRRRSRVAWHLFGHTLAALAGALTHHFTSGLF